MADDEEVKTLTKVLNSYYTYEQFALREVVSPKRLKWSALTLEEQSLLPWFPQYISSLEQCIKQNGEFTRDLALKMSVDWGVSSDPNSWTKSTYVDYDKVKSILKQILREWSEEADAERNVSFSRFFKFLEEKYPNFDDRQHVKVLIPGVGLGRLNFELVKRGFQAQGNEYTYHMLLASGYLMNRSYSKHAHTIFPFIHSVSNQKSRLLQLRPVYVPDVHSGEQLSAIQKEHPKVPIGGLMSIVSGSFVDLYGSDDLSISPHYTPDEQSKMFRSSNKENFDVIVTNFFLDTASNIIEYFKSISHCLKKEGYWLNFGPLLWHFEEEDDVYEIIKNDDNGAGVKTPNPVKGLELSRDDLVELSRNWFDLIVHESEIESGYSSDAKALGGWKYKCEYWIATKK